MLGTGGGGGDSGQPGGSQTQAAFSQSLNPASPHLDITCCSGGTMEQRGGGSGGAGEREHYMAAHVAESEQNKSIRKQNSVCAGNASSTRFTEIS